jgi:carbonic anhydrase
VKVSLGNLRSFSFVAEREAAGTLKLHGCWFAIAEGALYEYDEQAGYFRSLPESA